MSEATQRILDHVRTRAVRPLNRIALRAGGTRYVRGATATLKLVFYPRFRCPKTRRGNSSKALGIRVHRQLEHWINDDETTPKKFHPMATAIKKQLRIMGLKPTRAEVPIYSTRASVLTQIDALARRVNAPGKLVVISFKTGYNRAYTRKQGMCRGIDQPNSYKTHHQLQLALEVACVEEEYGEPVSEAYVIYTGWGDKKVVRVDPLEKWARRRGAKDALFRLLDKDAQKSGVAAPGDAALLDLRRVDRS